MSDIKNMFDKLHSKFKNDVFFEKFSDIYVKEFFMYISIKSDKNIIDFITPFIEINNILINLLNNNNLYDSINNEIENNNGNIINSLKLNYIHSDEQIQIGQENLLKLIKNIFNHDCISTIIKKINITVNGCGHFLNLDVYNSLHIIDLKHEIHHILLKNENILLHTNRIILTYKKNILKNENTLENYNIDNNAKIILSINMNINPYQK